MRADGRVKAGVLVGWVVAAAGLAGLAGCLVEVDYGGTRFRCDDGICPPGFVCGVESFCEPEPDDTGPGVKARVLTVDNSGREALAGFVAPVFLTSAEIDYELAGDNGENVRFVDQAQNLLAHDIDTWNPGGTSLVWVKLDMPADAAFEIIMRWNDPAPPQALDPGETYDDAFVAVWHLDDDPASGAENALLDASGAGLHGSSTADMNADSLVAGPLGDATHFAGGQSASFGDLAAFELPIYSWSAWIRADADPVIGADNSQPIFNADDQFNFSWDHAEANFAVGAAHRDAVGFTAAQITTPVTGSTWYLIAATYDGVGLSMYLDGALESSVALGPPIPTAGDMSLGNDPALPNFSGALDEVRIAAVARPPHWFDAYAAAVRGELIEFGPLDGPGE